MGIVTGAIGRLNKKVVKVKYLAKHIRRLETTTEDDAARSGRFTAALKRFGSIRLQVKRDHLS